MSLYWIAVPTVRRSWHCWPSASRAGVKHFHDPDPLKQVENWGFPFDFQSVGSPTTRESCRGYVDDPCEWGMSYAQGPDDGTASCRDAGPEHHQRVNNAVFWRTPDQNQNRSLYHSSTISASDEMPARRTGQYLTNVLLPWILYLRLREHPILYPSHSHPKQRPCSPPPT